MLSRFFLMQTPTQGPAKENAADGPLPMNEAAAGPSIDDGKEESSTYHTYTHPKVEILVGEERVLMDREVLVNSQTSLRHQLLGDDDVSHVVQLELHGAPPVHAYSRETHGMSALSVLIDSCLRGRFPKERLDIGLEHSDTGGKVKVGLLIDLTVWLHKYVGGKSSRAAERYWRMFWSQQRAEGFSTWVARDLRQMTVGEAADLLKERPELFGVQIDDTTKAMSCIGDPFGTVNAMSPCGGCYELYTNPCSKRGESEVDGKAITKERYLRAAKAFIPFGNKEQEETVRADLEKQGFVEKHGLDKKYLHMARMEQKHRLSAVYKGDDALEGHALLTACQRKLDNILEKVRQIRQLGVTETAKIAKETENLRKMRVAYEKTWFDLENHKTLFEGVQAEEHLAKVSFLHALIQDRPEDDTPLFEAALSFPVGLDILTTALRAKFLNDAQLPQVVLDALCKPIISNSDDQFRDPTGGLLQRECNNSTNCGWKDEDTEDVEDTPEEEEDSVEDEEDRPEEEEDCVEKKEDSVEDGEDQEDCVEKTEDSVEDEEDDMHEEEEDIPEPQIEDIPEPQREDVHEPQVKRQRIRKSAKCKYAYLSSPSGHILYARGAPLMAIATSNIRSTVMAFRHFEAIADVAQAIHPELRTQTACAGCFRRLGSIWKDHLQAKEHRGDTSGVIQEVFYAEKVQRR